MWHAEHTLETSAQPERIWEQMLQVADWPRWDTGLAGAALSGAFSPGTLGSVKFRDDRSRAFQLAAVTDLEGFTALTRLPLAQVRHIHHQESSTMGTRLTHRIEITGPLSWLYGWSLGRRLRQGLAPGMRRLARLAS